MPTETMSQRNLEAAKDRIRKMGGQIADLHEKVAARERELVSTKTVMFSVQNQLDAAEKRLRNIREILYKKFFEYTGGERLLTEKYYDDAETLLEMFFSSPRYPMVDGTESEKDRIIAASLDTIKSLGDKLKRNEENYDGLYNNFSDLFEKLYPVMKAVYASSVATVRVDLKLSDKEFSDAVTAMNGCFVADKAL